jgi:hypothetical protein
MAEAVTLERIRQKREERMRMGQMTAEILPIPSSPEIRVALIPLLEGEYDECMRAAAQVDVPDNVAGASVMDRQERREVVCRALREVDDYSKRVFTDTVTMMETLEPPDVNFFYDAYVEMQLQISPRLDELLEAEIDFLKDVFGTIQWSDLSGRQVYALSRFLSSLGQEQLTVKLPGRLSTRS